ncbi:MAG TPA: hypothetical protein VFM95_06155 [Microcella sp.]|nr:hypothetical protein [Microcella sp.]
MANPHNYGFRFARSFDGVETPQTITKPIASGYAPNTGADGSGGTAVNLNIGDPVQLLNNGTVRLVQPGQAADGTDIDDRVYGIVAGFPRVMIGGAPRPSSYYPSGTTYTGDDQQTLCKIIPVHNNIFEIDCDAAGGSSLDTKAEWQSVIGTANFVYSVLTSGAGQPKANPLLDTSDISEAADEVNQLRIVGLSKRFDTLDPSLTHVTLEVIFNMQQIFPTATSDATNVPANTSEANLEA